MSLHAILPKTSAYLKIWDGKTKWMHFLIEGDDLLERCNNIWHKVSADIIKEFNSESAYDKSFWKTKIKSHSDEVTDFYNKKLLMWTLIIYV